MAVGSVALHVGVVGGLLFVSLFRVEEVPPPSVTVTFFAEAAPPPPPPPPPPARRSTPRIEQPRVAEPKEIVQPPKEPVERPKEEPQDEAGVEGGVEGGVAGGVVGGVVGGLPSSAPPPPQKPVNVAPTVLERERTDGDNPPYPAAAKAAGVEATIVTRICVGADGAVTGVEIIRGNPAFDDAIVRAVSRWRYRPRTEDGKPVPYCGIAKFEFRLQ